MDWKGKNILVLFFGRLRREKKRLKKQEKIEQNIIVSLFWNGERKGKEKKRRERNCFMILEWTIKRNKR